MKKLYKVVGTLKVGHRLYHPTEKILALSKNEAQELFLVKFRGAKSLSTELVFREKINLDKFN